MVKIIKYNDKKNTITHLKKIKKIDVIKTGCDLLISFHNGQIIKDNIIKYLKGNCINFHNSSLPRNRGWAPILWTAYNNDPFAATIHKISNGLDTGDICSQKLIKKSLKKFTLEDVYKLLEEENLNSFKMIFPKIKKEIFLMKQFIKYKKQDEKDRSYNTKLESDILMKRFSLGYKTKINEIILLGKRDRSYR